MVYVNKMNGKGLVAGIIVWIPLAFFTVSQFTCVETNSCGMDNLFSACVIAVGMLGPAYLVALLVSDFFR